MQVVPDAPWIREAELHGIPPYDEGLEPQCPICGKACETIYKDVDGNEVGCDLCIQIQDACEWAEDKEEQL